jgi:FlaA1/EpsC-like NDP-sugar epimerase
VRFLSRLRVDLPVAVIDAMLVVGSFVSLLAVRFDGDIPDEYSDRMFAFLPVVVGIHLASNLVWGLYGQIWRYASATEAGRVVVAGACAGLAVFVVNPLRDFPVPRSVALFGAIVATMFIGLVRFQHRLFSFRRRMDRSASRVVVVGAGSAGAAIVRDMRRSERGPVPVLIVDDDPRKQGRSLLGVPVVGDTHHLEELVRRTRADQVLLAVPSADQQFVVVVMRAAESANVPLKVLPPVRDLLGGSPSVRAARELRIEDVLGRQQVDTDTDRIRAAIEGRRVLVTGAGGSIGAEIAAQVAALRPAVLALLDHDETHLHDVAARLDHSVPLELVLADICDRERLLARFAALRPALVFHAAAHKHVPLLEAHPLEAVETNVLGTANVVEAAAAGGVEHMVFISSDKAVNPHNVLGRSKRIGEQVTVLNMPPGARWCAVRFGNVVGSRGSVIPTFAAQIAAGGPVTVTDPRMTRYFMSIHEAVQLVLQAAVLADGGEVFMLDMGDPVNILDLAERMIRLSGRVVGADVPIRIVGQRPGEKLHEDLRAPDESSTPTAHPSILRVLSPAFDPGQLRRGIDDLERLVALGAEEDAARLLGDLANRQSVLDDGTMSAVSPP